MSNALRNIYYRPEWTCGRYDPKSHVALFYNLIAGASHYFEDLSADVIGIILSLPRNGHIDIERLSDISNISEKSLKPFLDNLLQLGLLTTIKPDKSTISQYRDLTICERRNKHQISKQKTQESYSHDDAETAYEKRIGGISNVMLELTYSCSEKCIHCYNIGATRNDNEKNHRGNFDHLSVDEYRRIIDELYDAGLCRVILSGGDPFSNAHIWDILDYLFAKEIAIDIFTNGISIVGKEKKVAKYYPRRVCLSLYSGSATVHDSITRTNYSWDRTVSVIENLTNLSIPTIIKCCVMKPNVKTYYTVSEIGKKLGATVQFDLNVSDSIDGDRCVSNFLRLSQEQLEIVLRDPNTAMYVGEDIENYGGIEINKERNACKAGYHTFCITPDGNLIPCCAFHMVFGNLRTNSLEEILRNDPRLKWWRSLKVSDYEECGQHEYCSFCNFCVGLNYSEHGTPIKAAENNCYMAKVRFRLATRMKNEQYDPLNGLTLQERLQSFPDMPIGKIQRIYNKR